MYLRNTVQDRLKQFIEYKGISVNLFEKKCGFSQGYVKGIGKTISPDRFYKIRNAFPDIDRDWLIYGEGTMLNDVHVVSGNGKEIANVDSSVATISGNVPIGHESVNVEALKEKISLLKQLLDEKERIIQDKERLIKILMKNM